MEGSPWVSGYPRAVLLKIGQPFSGLRARLRRRLPRHRELDGLALAQGKTSPVAS